MNIADKCKASVGHVRGPVISQVWDRAWEPVRDQVVQRIMIQVARWTWEPINDQVPDALLISGIAGQQRVFTRLL